MSGLPAGPFGVTAVSTAAALLVLMAVTFAVALKTGKHSVVDTAFGAGIALVALVALVSSIGYGQPRAARRSRPPRSCGARGWPSTSAGGTGASPRTLATATC